MEVRTAGAFVGRLPELQQLGRILDAAQAGRGATVLIAGEAGIGKTRLAAEVARGARERGFEVLLGRSIDLVGTELPYQPLAEALRPLGEVVRSAGSQLGMFEHVLALLTERASSAPVLLVLEDVHWADASTLDLAAFLAHNVDGHRVLLLATHRPGEGGVASSERMHRFADAVRRSGSALALELDPLAREEVAALLDAPAAVTEAIVTRSEGNPFFAEELLAAGGAHGELPRRVRDVLMARVAQLDRAAQSLLRTAAAAGRDVSYALLVAVAALPERDVRASLRAAVEHGLLVPEPASGRFRFRHALLAEAVYETVLPGEREWLHARLADELSRSGDADPAELAPHWALAGRAAEALAASVAAAGDAEAVFALAEARGHVERAILLWDAVPDAAERAGCELADLLARAAQRASDAGDAPRAVELTQRGIALGGEHPALLHARLSRFLFESGSADESLAAIERALELVPAQPPSPELAQVLASYASALTVLWRHEESVAVCQRALEAAGSLRAQDTQLRALTTLGNALAYVGRGDAGLETLARALELATERGEPEGLYRAYIGITDALTMLGRPTEAVRLGARGLEALRPFEIDHTVLTSNWIEALVASGAWNEAEPATAAAVRSITANYPHMPLMNRAELELGRGEFAAARAHLDAAHATIRHAPGLATYAGYVAELDLWERRYADAARRVREGMTTAEAPWGAQIRVWLCALGLRAQAELAALARARRDDTELREALQRAGELLAVARAAAAEASRVTPNAAGWLALAEAEHERAAGVPAPRRWSGAASKWDELERPPVAAYCRWREAEALVAAGAPRAEATAPLREAHAVAARLRARPLLRELELLAQRARLDPAPLDTAAEAPPLEHALGLTPREAEVLALLARGLTNRELAAELVISVKTAGVHVSNILRKLDAPNRLEAAAIAHRLAPPASASAPERLS